MIQIPGKKQSCLAISLVFVLAVSGAFIFSVFENPLDFEPDGNKPYSNGIITPVDNVIDWLAENTSIITKVNKHSSSLLRNGLLRVLKSVGLHSDADYITVFSLRTAKINHFLFSKKTILLKLRI
ncbi:MAG: hypothetical protein LBU85_03855 [Treponema sp.]|jgi:hypothetical protein|nr:hypothetical protein [Treponema sp.]